MAKKATAKLSIGGDARQGKRALDQVQAELKKTGSVAQRVSRQIKTGFKNAFSTLARSFKYAIGGTLIYSILQGRIPFVTAAIAQRKEILQLDRALKHVGTSWREAGKGIREYARWIQDTTNYGDTEVYEVLRKLIDMTGDYKASLEGVRPTLELVAGSDLELASAARYVALAYIGETSMLRRYGIIIDESIPKQERFAELLRLTKVRFDDAAERMKKADPFPSLMNEVQDLSEMIGDSLFPAIEKVVVGIRGRLRNVNIGVTVEGMFSAIKKKSFWISFGDMFIDIFYESIKTSFLMLKDVFVWIGTVAADAIANALKSRGGIFGKLIPGGEKTKTEVDMPWGTQRHTMRYRGGVPETSPLTDTLGEAGRKELRTSYFQRISQRFNQGIDETMDVLRESSKVPGGLTGIPTLDYQISMFMTSKEARLAMETNAIWRTQHAMGERVSAMLAQRNNFPDTLRID